MNTSKINSISDLRKRRYLAARNMFESRRDGYLDRAEGHRLRVVELDKQITAEILKGLVWLEVPKRGGYYLATTCGKLYSTRKRKMLKGSLDLDGYVQVSIKERGLMVKRKLHRIVAQTFIPNPQNKPQVNHLDFNTKNNAVSNLAWATSKEDAEHKVAAGRQAKGKSFPIRKGVKMKNKSA